MGGDGVGEEAEGEGGGGFGVLFGVDDVEEELFAGEAGGAEGGEEEGFVDGGVVDERRKDAQMLWRQQWCKSIESSECKVSLSCEGGVSGCVEECRYEYGEYDRFCAAEVVEYFE